VNGGPVLYMYCNDTDINVHLPYCKFCPWNQQVVITVKRLIDHINDPFEVCVPWWTSIQSDRGRTKTMRLWKRCRVIGLLLSLSLLLLQCLLFQIKWGKCILLLLHYICKTITASWFLPNISILKLKKIKTTHLHRVLS
jgi:hypothetical protein